jgi:hypothetical protein
VTVQDLDGSSYIERYVVGAYWGATILSSVGFGDIIPASSYSFIQTTSRDFSLLSCRSFAAWASVISSMLSAPYFE